MNFLKIIGKFFAGLFILFGITVFIISYFGSYAVDNFNILENDLNNQTLNLISQNTGMDTKQIQDYCNQNKDDENCKVINQNPIVERIKKEINDFKYYGNAMRVIGFMFIIFGFLLFVLCSGWINGLRQTSLISFIGVLFSYFYYKYAIMGALNSFLPKEILSFVNNWANATINQTLNTIMVLGAIFLILTVGLYILKYKMKPLKKVSKEETSKENGPRR